MSAPEKTSRMAYEVPRGNAVQWPRADNPQTVFLKAERKGTEYIHHYLIKVSPMQAEGLALIYVDPEEILIDTGCAPTFDYSSGENRPDPDIGHIFKNNKGLYLKVIEDPKSQKMFAFIDITSGEVKRRQERLVETVYRSWEISLKV